MITTPGRAETTEKSIWDFIRTYPGDRDALLDALGVEIERLDAALALARREAFEVAAETCDALAGNPPSDNTRHPDWQAGIQDAAKWLAFEIRALSASPVARERDEPKLAKRPVAFRVKDFADGWILFHDERAAQQEANETGALMQGLYVRDGDPLPSPIRPP